MVKVWYENPKGAAPAQGLYSHAGCMEGGRAVYLAGQLAVASDGSVAGVGDFDTQFHWVFGNMRDVLTGMHLDFSYVIKFTTYLTSADNISDFMRLRAENFPKWFDGDAFPPNTLLIVNRLVKPEFLLEVEAVVGAP